MRINAYMRQKLCEVSGNGKAVPTCFPFLLLPHLHLNLQIWGWNLPMTSLTWVLLQMIITLEQNPRFGWWFSHSSWILCKCPPIHCNHYNLPEALWFFDKTVAVQHQQWSNEEELSREKGEWPIAIIPFLHYLVRKHIQISGQTLIAWHRHLLPSEDSSGKVIWL